MSEEDPKESHTSIVNNFTLPSRPSIAQAAQGKRKASENKEQSTAPSKTMKNPKNKAWRADQVELLLRYVKDFKTKCDFNGIDFEADLASMYTEISSKVTVTSHSIEMLQREQIIKGKNTDRQNASFVRHYLCLHD